MSASVGTSSSWAATSRFAVSARVIPAQVEVVGVDGCYADGRRLRDAAEALVRAAESLERTKGGPR